MTVRDTVTTADKINMKWVNYILKMGESVSESEFDDDRSRSMVDEAFTMFIGSIELVELVS